MGLYAEEYDRTSGLVENRNQSNGIAAGNFASEGEDAKCKDSAKEYLVNEDEDFKRPEDANALIDKPAELLSVNGIAVNSWFCVWTLIVTMASTMMSMGLAVGAMNPTMLLLTNFYNETYMGRNEDPIPGAILKLLLALTVSLILLGGFLGALSLGLFVRYLSRKQAMITINLINVVGVMLSSVIGYAAASYELIIIGRLLMGFVAGVAMNLVPMIISESSTKQRAPLYLSLIGVNLSLGGLIGLTFGLDMVFGNDELWPVLLAVPSVPSLIYLVGSPWLPETPSYLSLLGRKKEAIETLEKLRDSASSSLLHQEMAAINREQKLQGEVVRSMTVKEMVSEKGYRWQLFLVLMVFLQSEFCGINAIGMYTNMIFDQAGVEEEYVTAASLIVYFVQFLVSMAGSIVVDRYGPKRLAIFFLAVMGASMAFLTVSVALSHLTFMPYLSVAAVAIYVLSWACGPNVTLFPLIGALTTETTREACFKLGGGIFWISSWFVGFVPTYMMDLFGAFAFTPWAITNCFFAVFFYFKIPETRGKSPEQIQKEIHGRRDSNEMVMQPLQAV